MTTSTDPTYDQLKLELVHKLVQSQDGRFAYIGEYFSKLKRVLNGPLGVLDQCIEAEKPSPGTAGGLVRTDVFQTAERASALLHELENLLHTAFTRNCTTLGVSPEKVKAAAKKQDLHL